MESSKEAIAVRITRLNRQIIGKVINGTNKLGRKIDRESLLDALTVLYDECNDDPVKKCDELVRTFLDKYRSPLAELKRARVGLSDFEMIQMIGRGHYGEVHMVREKQTADVYALKSVRKEQVRKRVVGAEDERDILATASGNWIPKLQYAFQDNTNLYLVMELCNGGDLAGLLLRQNHPLSERDAAFYIAEVAHALKTLHGMGYVHRDVKPQNIFLDRCGHVKLGDFGSCARLSEGGCVAGGTADYVAPELLSTDCSAVHSVCLEYCRRVNTAISACDYWSLGVVAFELVTLNRPFSSGENDTMAQILSNIQKYEREPNAQPPFPAPPLGPSASWRELTAGLLRVAPARRYNYLDTLQHPALGHLALHAIRDQVPPWVPHLRGAEDSSYLAAPERRPAPPSAAPFRTRPPFAGHLPFVGYSYVAPEENEDSHAGGFSSSHDCTAIDLATYKSAEKLAAMRGRELASLQNRLVAAEAAAEAAASEAAERARRLADEEAEGRRAALQADLAAVTLQHKRLERQIEVEREERAELQRANRELNDCINRRGQTELKAAAQASELQGERDALRGDLARLEGRVRDLQLECSSALAAADAARQQHRHYQDTIAKERALRRQTLCGSEAAADTAAREARARAQAEERLARLTEELTALRDHRREQAAAHTDSLREKDREIATINERLNELQNQVTQERMRAASLSAELQAAAAREAALEEQSERTQARLQQRLEDTLHEHARHQEKVTTLEQLVRQLEREVSALENRSCARCADREAKTKVQVTSGTNTDDAEDATDTAQDNRSETESYTDATAHVHASAQISLLKEQLERAEAQLLARAEEIAALRQETRTANLARWRKEKEFNDLSLDSKVTARDLKRTEERLQSALEARKSAEDKASLVHKEITTLRPQYELMKKELERYKEQWEKLQKSNEVLQAEVDRSRNDIRKLKSELQFSESRRMAAENNAQEATRERGELWGDLAPLREQREQLLQNNKALQDACSLLEDQLTDLEKLADLHELKNKELEAELSHLRGELESCRSRAAEAERSAADHAAAADRERALGDHAREELLAARSQLTVLRERLENRESLVSSLEARVSTLEGEASARDAALSGAARRLRALQEEAAGLRTRAQAHHSAALGLQAELAAAQEETSAAHEAHEAAAAWWRTRETKADATMRQQAKLIDFLQAKVEEAGRKKGSLSNKLFGRSGRRSAASPPLLRVNRELREEVERLRSKLAAANSTDAHFPPTPRKEKKIEKPKKTINVCLDNDPPDQDSVLVIWADGGRERVQATCAGSSLVLVRGSRVLRATLSPARPLPHLPHNEANRAFGIKLEQSDGGAEATVVCSSIAEKCDWVSRLTPIARGGFEPTTLLQTGTMPTTALYLAPVALAIGCRDGLQSLRGVVRVEWEAEVSPPRRGECAVSLLCSASTRVLVCSGGLLAHAGRLALGSALRRAGALRPAVSLTRVQLTDNTPPHLIKGIADATDGPCAAVACGRRVYLLKFDAAGTQFKIARSLTVDRPPDSLLLTDDVLYIAGEKPLKLNLPSGALESFAMDEPIVAAAFKKHSPPKAILQIRIKPVEILLCYSECGIFVDECGRRTRNEDPKWSSAVHGWEFVNPFLYCVGEDKVTIIYINEETYKAPPCTCDTTSMASSTSASECYQPEIFNYKVNEPAILGTAPNGIIIRSKVDDDYHISILEGKQAFRSIGTSLDSLNTVSDVKGSTPDLAQSLTDLHSPQDESQESIEVTTGFLADIRNRARQLRTKNRLQISPDDVIKEILTTEIGLRPTSNGRKSPALTSEFDSDSETESEVGTGSTQGTAEVCAEMFTRQVRFQ